MGEEACTHRGRRLILIGPRGAGKTSAGRLAASLLGWPFFDADLEAERRAGMDIASLMARQGEAAFRTLEAQVLADLCLREPAVVATGGGAVLNEESRALIRSSGLAIWLDAAPEALWGRIQADPDTPARRPRLAGGGVEEVRQLRARREPLYRQCAQARLDTGGRTVDEVARALATLAAAPSPTG
jgi:shikimate kinase